MRAVPRRSARGFDDGMSDASRNPSDAAHDPWKEFSTIEQRKLLNAACGDLAKCFVWYGNRLSKDDWRHFLSGTVL